MLALASLAFQSLRNDLSLWLCISLSLSLSLSLYIYHIYNLLTIFLSHADSPNDKTLPILTQFCYSNPHPHISPRMIHLCDTCTIWFASPAGSRRPSLASVHSTSSSVRSYSMMRFEKEVQQKEIRQEMKLRLARLQQQAHLTQNKPQIVIGEALLQHGALSRVTIPTPSPLTPNSLDELLPSLDENQEVSSEFTIFSL